MFNISFRFLSTSTRWVTTDDCVLADDMIERNQNTVKLHDVSPLALRQLIDYAYSGEITITEDNVQVIFFVFYDIYSHIPHARILPHAILPPRLTE